MYRMPVREKKNPFINMELNLKESQKYVKQGRTYTSSLIKLETLMWFVYEMELNRTHRQLGIFAACEREILYEAQNIGKNMEQIRVLSGELKKREMSPEKQNALEAAVQTVKSVKSGSCYKFWDMRVEISDRAEELLRDAAKNDPGELKNAARNLNLGGLLHDMCQNFHDSTGKLDEALEKLESIGPMLTRKMENIGRTVERYQETYDEEGLLFCSLKDYIKKIRTSCICIEKATEKAAAKYDRIENRIADTEKLNADRKKENKPSVRKKIETAQMRQPEGFGRVAEERREEIVR